VFPQPSLERSFNKAARCFKGRALFFIKAARCFKGRALFRHAARCFVKAARCKVAHIGLSAGRLEGRR
jgi:hypothetical protein